MNELKNLRLDPTVLVNIDWSNNCLYCSAQCIPAMGWWGKISEKESASSNVEADLDIPTPKSMEVGDVEHVRLDSDSDSQRGEQETTDLSHHLMRMNETWFDHQAAAPTTRSTKRRGYQMPMIDEQSPTFTTEHGPSVHFDAHISVYSATSSCRHRLDSDAQSSVADGVCRQCLLQRVFRYRKPGG